MSSEVKEKLEVNKPNDKRIRKAIIELNDDLHSRILTHQMILTGQRTTFVTFKEACVDLLHSATRNIKRHSND